MPNVVVMSDNNSCSDTNHQVFFVRQSFSFDFLSDNNSQDSLQIICHFKPLLEYFCVCHSLLVYQIIKLFNVRTFNSNTNFLSLRILLNGSSSLLSHCSSLLSGYKRKSPCQRTPLSLSCLSANIALAFRDVYQLPAPGFLPR